MKFRLPLAGWILLAMFFGVVIGYVIFLTSPDKAAATETAGYISVISDVFLRLIKMLIGPLVFSTLVVGIAHMGDAGAVGRVFGKAMMWFLTASLLSLAVGLMMANILQPGHHLALPLPDVSATTSLQTSAFTLKAFVTHWHRTGSPPKLRHGCRHRRRRCHNRPHWLRHRVGLAVG